MERASFSGSIRQEVNMEFGKTIIVAVDLHETSKEQLSQLRNISFLKNAEVHFVHVFQTTIMTYGLNEFCQIYPLEPDRRELELNITKTLNELCEGSIDGKIITRCLFDEKPKEEFCLYAKEIQADTMIIFTREKHGIFESSFAQYAARHSPCHVLILKP